VTDRRPFADLPGTAASHFKLHFYAAMSQLLAAAESQLPSPESPGDRFPELHGYHAELMNAGVPALAPSETSTWWRQAIADWEARVPAFLPIRAVRDTAAVGHESMTLVFVAGLIEEDARFGAIFEAVNGVAGQHRATTGLLMDCGGAVEGGDVRVRIRTLEDLGLLRVINADVPRLQRAHDVPSGLWDVLRGDAHRHPVPWAQFVAPAALQDLNALVLPQSIRRTATELTRLLESREVTTVIVRGPRQNGRRTLMGGLARACGRGMLVLDDLTKPAGDQWRQVGLLATALQALPVVVCDVGPGDTFDLPRVPTYDGPVGIVIGRSGGVKGTGAERSLTVRLDVPDVAVRREHWQAALGPHPIHDLATISTSFRMTSGNIRRAAALAPACAALSGRATVTTADVRQAAGALNRQSLDNLALRIPASGDWNQLATRDDTFRELMDLELRCRHRERLVESIAATPGLQCNCGVRALFRGPSGTGKTLAARLLASALQMDLYRLDLSSVVNKYIGETEKNLDRVLSRAEELDVILLLDEGDALLTQRTNVQTSNDRYANLETNYLLQRLESFEGILIITTNAGDRIDAAFDRRIDVAIDFHPPQAAERWEIWQTQLPSAHDVDVEFLNEMASRCALTGGQIRNAMLHAHLLSIDAGGIVTTALLDAAVRREYRKAGAVCPLRPANVPAVAV
jgi:hypothetical protein